MKSVAESGTTVSAAPLRLVTLGVLRLVDADGRDIAQGHRKLLALLAYLARRGRGVGREELATLMWGERREENARASLRQALFQLKRVLGDVLEVGPDSVVLRSDGLQVDALSFEGSITGGHYRDAALAWNGDFLAGAEDSGGESFRVWLEGERASLRRLLTRALEELTTDATRRGAWPEAISWAERWAGAMPLDERPHRRLVELLSLAGRNLEALSRHAGYASRVRAEFGAGPSEDFLRIGKQLERRAREGAPRASGAVESPRAALRLPDMVGRQAAFSELTSAWHEARRGRATVVVLEGDAGVGKTRLAEEFLRTVEPRGAAFVVLRARAYDADREVRLALARELLAPLSDAPGLLGAPRSALAELARLVPSVQEHIRDLPGPSDFARALDEAIARILADISTEAPIVMFVDDLPRTDSESRRLVLSLARRVPRDARVLVLLTARSGELGRPDELRDLRALRQLQLGPLELVEVEALVGSMLPLGDEPRRAVAERLFAETGGTPSVVVERVGALVDTEQLTRDADGSWRLVQGSDSARATSADFVTRALSGRYTIERTIAKGGVLTTYAAVDLRTKQRVDLQVPSRRVAGPVEAERFTQTFARVASLSYPGIMSVTDYGAPGGVLYYATPPVEGASLRERVERERPLDVAESVRVAISVARALAHAHEHGVHHFDLRPKHVVESARGLQLARIGLVEALNAGAIGEGGYDDTGVLIGAPAYLSPEQLAGEPLDGVRTDIYSLGCVLYEMLVGEPPFGAKGRGLIARKLTEIPPPARSLRVDIPEPLDCILTRCLARSPADRYPGAAPLADALEEVRSRLPH